MMANRSTVTQRGSKAIGLRSIFVLSVVFLAYTANARLSERHPHNGLLRPYHTAPPDVALSSDEQQQLKMGEPVYTHGNLTTVAILTSTIASDSGEFYRSRASGKRVMLPIPHKCS